MTITEWLSNAVRQLLLENVPSARLDAELILSHTLRKPRTWLHAHGDDILDSRQREIANARLDLRRDRVPVAYIVGHKEFYGRRFAVTTATLIPRPESEAVIELLATLPLKPGASLVDVGTGSGCLGITAKLEHPELSVSLIDIDQHALTVAKKNAALLHAEVEFYVSDLLQQYPYTADIILANLPYVDEEWEVSPETRHEPSQALFADDNGMHLIKDLFLQAHSKLRPGGSILIESDLRQHHAINHYAEAHGFSHTATNGLITLYKLV